MQNRPLQLLCLACALGAGCTPPPPKPTTPSQSGTPRGAQQSPSPAPDPAELMPAPAQPPAETPMRIAFGSCNDLATPQLLWEPIRATEPALWIWLGDNIYADTTNIRKMRLLYDRTKAEPGYAALRAATPIIGTWDDHDYGQNDAGKDYPKRVEAQGALLDFLDEPADSPRREQKGVYAAYDFGEAPRMVRVIVLDTRYHRERPGPEADVLGEPQWRWLQQQLSDSPAAVHLIVSSIQLVAHEHPHEKWANFPAARARLLALIGMSGVKNPLVLSGDRHYAELSRTALPPDGAPLYDLTSSSLSRPWDEDPSEPNPDRVGDYYWEVNFGLLEIDWAARQLRMQVRGADGEVKIEHAITLAP